MCANHAMITASDVNTLLDTDHEDILEAFSWSQRKAETLLTLVAPYSTGTISGTAGVSTVTGSGVTWTAAMEGRWIRAGSNTFYLKINTLSGGSTFILENTLPADIAAGSTYTIFQHVYSLPSNFARITSVTSDQKLTETTEQNLDRLDPYRSATATYPTQFIIKGLDTSDNYEIELWPVPSAAGIVRINYLKTNALSSDTTSPLYPSELLVLKGAESACSFLLARTGDQAWAALADRYGRRYQESLEEMKNADLARNSPASYIRDGVYSKGQLGSDFDLSHDVWWRY